MTRNDRTKQDMTRQSKTKDNTTKQDKEKKKENTRPVSDAYPDEAKQPLW
jgi:hypothetical protein